MSGEPIINTACLPIVGGDYESGGGASKYLKDTLKKIGAAPENVRRTMIAAYEAEMNVVIHARRGEMRIAVDSNQVDVLVSDDGPGIPDIELAMREGYSTAPPAARELGFGAGMGLPNIRRNSDRFSLNSKVGRGTQLRFTVYLQPQKESRWTPNSLKTVEGLCKQCLACLRACPTQAIRVQDGRPDVLDHLCVDCTSCIAACPEKALDVHARRALPELTPDTLLILPQSFLEQFGADVEPDRVFDILAGLGFKRVRLLSEWEEALRRAVADYADDEDAVRPVLSPMCPAVVNLIRVKFPSLLPNLAPFVSPIEAAREEIASGHIVFAGICPAHATVLRQPAIMTRIDVVHPYVLRKAVKDRLGKTRGRARRGRCLHRPIEVVEVSGMGHVVKVLEAVENGFADDCSPMELYACDQACFGTPLWPEDPFVARSRYAPVETPSPEFGLLCEAEATPRVERLTPRAGIRLDADMNKAIEKLARIEKMTGELPGRNCGVCGAPTCAAHAEDVVLGRNTVTACIYLGRNEGEPE